MILLNSINPMQTIFAAEIVIQNEYDQKIWVTPIGQNKKGKIPLALLKSDQPPIMHESTRADFEIAARSSIRLCYDFDDMNFSDIAFKMESGEMRMVIVGEFSQFDDYTGPGNDQFVVAPSKSREISEPVLRAVEIARAPMNKWFMRSTWAVPLVLLLMFTFFFLRHRRKGIEEIDSLPLIQSDDESD